MQPRLAAEQAKRLLEELKRAVAKEDCWSCDCLQGFIAQLVLDAVEGVTKLTGPLRVPTAGMHGCLGCDPCPPAAAYAAYLGQSRDAAPNGEGIGDHKRLASPRGSARNGSGKSAQNEGPVRWFQRRRK